jgi:hypothetical protein
MSISESNKTPLEILAVQVVDGRFAVRAMRFSQLNPEQQLAVALQQLAEHQKGRFALLDLILAFPHAYVEWRKTPEGQAWAQEQAAKRAADEAAKAQP